MDIASNAVLMTPDHAKKLLETNTINRKLRPGWVNYLVDQIHTGQWYLNTDAIGVSASGKLVNGQHRLSAIAQSGRAVPVLLATGIPDDAFLITDTGIKRSTADILGISPLLSSDATLAAQIMLGTGQGRIPAPMIRDALAWWEPVSNVLTNTLKGRAQRGLSSSPLRVGFGLRWAIERTPTGRAYVLTELDNLMGNNVQHLHVATATLWRRITTGATRSTNSRLATAAAVYHCMDYKRRNTKPAFGRIEEIISEMREYLKLMQDAFTAGPDRDGHPYLWTTRPVIERELHGAAARKVA